MDHLYALRDLGVADPATDPTGEQVVRAALAREIEHATVPDRPARRAWWAWGVRPRWLAGVSLAAAAAAAAVIVLVGAAASPPPAFAVTRHADGSVSLTIHRATSLAQVNHRLAALGIERIARHAITAEQNLSSIPSCSSPIPAGWNGEWVQMAGSASGPGYTINETVPPGTWVLVTCASVNPNDTTPTTTPSPGTTDAGNTGSGTGTG